MGVRCAAVRGIAVMLLVGAAFGCNFDTAPLALANNSGAQRTVSGDGEPPQAGQPAAAGSSAHDSGANDSGAPPSNIVPPASDPIPTDASPPPPSDPPDAADVPSSDSAVADAGTDADPGTDASTPPPVDPPPPTKGLLFDRCVTDHGCSLGLVCYGAGPGHCAQPCTENSDCVPVDGFEFTCSANDGACRIDCSDDDNQDACPQGLTCVNRGSSEQRCMLPREQGTGDRELFEPCDRAHGDGDCVDGLVCYRSDDSRIDGPGYCTEQCGDGESSCNDVPSSFAELECAGDVCRFDCSKSACPLGMACEPIGDRGVCHYPSAQNR
jgi:hypothetical protein